MKKRENLRGDQSKDWESRRIKGWFEERKDKVGKKSGRLFWEFFFPLSFVVFLLEYVFGGKRGNDELPSFLKERENDNKKEGQQNDAHPLLNIQSLLSLLFLLPPLDTFDKKIENISNKEQGILAKPRDILHIFFSLLFFLLVPLLGEGRRERRERREVEKGR